MNNKVFMAIGKTQESSEGTGNNRFIGVGSTYILGVNPNKAQLEKLYNTTIDEEPNYIGTGKVGEEDVPQIRLDFILRVDPEKNNGLTGLTKASYFLKDSPRYNQDGTKVQVINKYGETTWLTLEDAKNKVIPEGLSWFENADIRPAFVGEEDLIRLIKVYLNIPSKGYTDKKGVKHEIANKADAEARLDHIPDYFKGDISEIKKLLSLEPKNKVKFAFGIKTTDENKQYQDLFIQYPLKNSVSNYSRLDKEIQDRKNNGGYSHTEFSVEPLKVYTVEATSFTQTAEQEAPEVDTKEWF